MQFLLDPLPRDLHTVSYEPRRISEGLIHAMLLDQLGGDVVGLHVPLHAGLRQDTKLVGGLIVQPHAS